MEEVVNEVSAPEVEQEAIVEPEPQIVPEPPKEFVEEFQPMDDLGRPIGGKQKFIAKSEAELRQELVKQNVELIKKMRELNRKLRIGDIEKEDIPEEILRYEQQPELQEKPLTAEQKFQIAQDMKDPDKIDKAFDTLAEAKLGAKPDVIRQRLNQQQERDAALRAKAEADAFTAETPEYYKCSDNADIIRNWMIKNGLAPVKDNFKFAFKRLTAAGLLLEHPIVREERPPVVVPVVKPTVAETPENTPPVVEQPTRISNVEPPQKRPAAKVASGLTKSTPNMGEEEIKPQSKFTREQVEKMGSEEYRQKLKDPEFRKFVDSLPPL